MVFPLVSSLSVGKNGVNSPMTVACYAKKFLKYVGGMNITSPFEEGQVAPWSPEVNQPSLRIQPESLFFYIF